MDEQVADPGYGAPPPQMGYLPTVQSPEFLKYLLESGDSAAQIQMQLEGMELLMKESEEPQLVQVRPPMVNPALRNSIMSFFFMYGSKPFTTTNLQGEQITKMLYNLIDNMIDILEDAKTYSAANFQQDPAYKANYPAHLVNAQQQILLIVEQNARVNLNRSWNAITLNKITGMHTSSEFKTPGDNKKRGVLSGIISRVNG